MTDTIKKYASIILDEINKANHILLHCHPSPDPDSVGSALAMKIALESINKKVTLIKGDDSIPKEFDFPGVNTILQKSYKEINTADFDLFIVLDSGSKSMITSPIESIDIRTIVIDHHKSNEGYGDINCIDSTYPATGQLLFDLLNEMNIKINHDIALNLFMGIFTDTGGFRYRNSGSETLRVAFELSKLAPDYIETIFTMENSKRKESIVFEGLALSSIKEFFDGKLAIASVSFDEIIKNNIKEEDILIGGISNKIKSVKGFEISVTMYEKEKGLVKISIRTRDPSKYDASKLAVSLGGGGHIGAAGAKLNMTIEQAIDKVVEKTKLIYNL